MSDCPHDLAERETACADGMCPLCLSLAIEARDRTIAEFDQALRDSYKESARLSQRAEQAESALAIKEKALAEAERDAARWRELRRQHEHEGVSLCVWEPDGNHGLRPVGSMPGELDEALDAALNPGTGEAGR